jgi:hypothetical protein
MAFPSFRIVQKLHIYIEEHVNWLKIDQQHYWNLIIHFPDMLPDSISAGSALAVIGRM